jgi:hypothetical protein
MIRGVTFYVSKEHTGTETCFALTVLDRWREEKVTRRTYVKPEWHAMGMPIASAACRGGSGDVGMLGLCYNGTNADSCSAGTNYTVQPGYCGVGNGASAQVVCTTGNGAKAHCAAGNGEKALYDCTSGINALG